MSFTVTFETKRLVSSSKANLWQAFINTCGLEHTLDSQKSSDLENVKAKGLFLKPLGFNFSVPVEIIKIIPQETIILKCRFYSITCLQRFDFKKSFQGAEIISTEILTGYLLILARLIYSPKRLSMANQAWLKQICDSAKNMT